MSRHLAKKMSFGTVTGRLSSSAPNIQNTARDPSGQKRVEMPSRACAEAFCRRMRRMGLSPRVTSTRSNAFDATTGGWQAYVDCEEPWQGDLLRFAVAAWGPAPIGSSAARHEDACQRSALHMARLVEAAGGPSVLESVWRLSGTAGLCVLLDDVRERTEAP